MPLIAASLSLAVFFVIAENHVSKTFGECIDYIRTQQSPKDASQKTFTIAQGLVRQGVCTLHVIDAHNGFFTLACSVAVAFFTFTLWRSTEKLWATGAEQSRLTKEALKIAREQFVMEHRPWISINIEATTPMFFEEDGNFHFDYSLKLQNYGQTPAQNVVFQVLLIDERILPIERAHWYIRHEMQRLYHESGKSGGCIFPGEPSTRYLRIESQKVYGAKPNVRHSLENPIRLKIVVCACYSFFSRAQSAYTEISFVIATDTPGSHPIAGVGWAIDSGRDIPKEHLVIGRLIGRAG